MYLTLERALKTTKLFHSVWHLGMPISLNVYYSLKANLIVLQRWTILTGPIRNVETRYCQE